MSSLPTRQGTPTASEQKTNMSNTVKDCDLDLECINPVDDLVLFRPVRGACIRGENVVARYTLGSEFTPSSWDWVGLFTEGWSSHRDYISYHWAPSMVIDPRRRNRRSVLFTSEDFEAARTMEDSFQFLYVTSWNHVVGVSPSFRLEGAIGEDEDLCFDLMEKSIERPLSTKLLAKRKLSAHELFPDKGDLHFDVLERSIQGAKKPKPSLIPFTFTSPARPADICNPLRLDGDMDFELLEKLANQQQEPMKESNNFADNMVVPARPVAMKKKVLTVVRDHESLTGNFGPERPVADLLQMLYQCPIVRNYVENQERSVVPYDMSKPIFDIKSSKATPCVTEISRESKSEASIPELEFPVRLPIMPGPKSVLLNMEEKAKRCNACTFGKTATPDFIRQEERTDKAMNRLRNEIRSLKKQIQHAKTQKKLMAKQKDIKYHEAMERKSVLEKTVLSLKAELKEAQKAVRESTMKVQLQLTPRSLCDQFLMDAFLLLQERGYKLLVDNDGGRHALVDLSQGNSQEDGWMTRSPKRIGRMRAVISSQSGTIQNLVAAVIAQRESISRHVTTMQDLRQQVATLENANKDKDRKLVEMTKRVRGLLSARSKDLTNEWRLFARKIKEPAESAVGKSKIASKKCGTKKGKATSSVSKQVVKYAPYTSKKPADTSTSSVQTDASPVVAEQATSSQIAFINENAPETKVIRRKRPHATVKICHTCGQTFGPEVSAHLIEEHLLFHEQFGQRKIFM